MCGHRISRSHLKECSDFHLLCYRNCNIGALGVSGGQTRKIRLVEQTHKRILNAQAARQEKRSLMEKALEDTGTLGGCARNEKPFWGKMLKSAGMGGTDSKINLARIESNLRRKIYQYLSIHDIFSSTTVSCWLRR